MFISDQMVSAGVQALGEVLGASEESRSTLTEYDREAVVLIFERMRSLEDDERPLTQGQMAGDVQGAEVSGPGGANALPLVMKYQVRDDAVVEVFWKKPVTGA